MSEEEDPTGADLKQMILDCVSDLVSNFLYYDRKDDEDLPRDVIENAIEEGIITADEIADAFREELKNKVCWSFHRRRMKDSHVPSIQED